MMTHWTPKMVTQVLGERLAAKGWKITRLFRSVDEDKSGSISHEEFRTLLARMNIVMTDSDFVEFMKTVDDDNSGQVMYSEVGFGRVFTSAPRRALFFF